MDMETPSVPAPRSVPAAEDVQQAVEQSSAAHVVKQVPAKRAKGKRKRVSSGIDVSSDCPDRRLPSERYRSRSGSGHAIANELPSPAEVSRVS